MKKLVYSICVITACLLIAGNSTRTQASIVVSTNPNGAISSIVYTSTDPGGAYTTGHELFNVGGTQVADYGFYISNEFGKASIDGTTSLLSNGSPSIQVSSITSGANSVTYSGTYHYRTQGQTNSVSVDFSRSYDWSVDDALLVTSTLTNTGNKINKNVYFFDTFNPNQGTSIGLPTGDQTFNNIVDISDAIMPIPGIDPADTPYGSVLVSVDDGSGGGPYSGLTFMATSGGGFVSTGDGNYITSWGQLNSMFESSGPVDGDNALSNGYTNIANKDTSGFAAGETKSLSILYTFGDNAADAINTYIDYSTVVYVREAGFLKGGNLDGDHETALLDPRELMILQRFRMAIFLF